MINGGKAYNRGVEYDVTTSLAIKTMRFDAIVSVLPHGHICVQCSTAKMVRHDMA